MKNILKKCKRKIEKYKNNQALDIMAANAVDTQYSNIEEIIKNLKQSNYILQEYKEDLKIEALKIQDDYNQLKEEILENEKTISTLEKILGYEVNLCNN